MQVSTNSESRNFAVQGAALYQDIFSFKILADESQSKETVAAISAAAQGDLKAYSNTPGLVILREALINGDAAEKNCSF